MKIQVLNEKDNELQLIVDGVEESFMNLLRRNCAFTVPTFAIEDVYFDKNSSGIYDEILAHRIGLLPIKVDKDIFSLKKPEIHFTLSAEGPNVVRASNLVTKGTKVKVLYPETPLVVLSKNQKVELKATAIPGTGEDHMKWSPGNSYYFHYPPSAKGNEDLDKLRQLLDAEEIGTLKNKPNKFIFVIESWGQKTPKEILTQALKKVESNLKELKLK